MLVDKLQVIEDKFMDLEQRISDPEVIARQDEWRKLTRQHAQLSETVEAFREYKKVLAGPILAFTLSTACKTPLPP